jgi:type II secretion system protein I
MGVRGFTLVEVLVALFIFSVVFLPLTGVFVAESKFERAHERKMIALLVAKDEIEKNKGHYGKEGDEEYQVTMAGSVWNVRRSEENEELAAGADSSKLRKKSFITVSVAGEKDTACLAEFRVMRETYR